MMLQKNNDIQTENIRNRLILILDSVLNRKKKEARHSHSELALNEGQLELWEQILDQILIIKGEIQKALNYPIPTTSKLLLMELPPSSEKLVEDFEQRFLLSLGRDQIQLFDPMNQKKSERVQSLRFKKGIIKRHASYSFIQENRCLIIGGSTVKDPNLKSKEILLLSVQTQELKKYGQLSQPLSSHSTIFIDPMVYIIGGNRNHNIISKYCYTFNIESRVVLEISSLNYSAASMAICEWNQEFIYKIGGVGECFQAWDISPYIERYSIHQDFWEVINPQIKIGSNLLGEFSLHAHSICYRNARESQIVVLGGYGFDKRSSENMFSLKVPETSDGEHQLEKLGRTSLFKGGFHYNHCLYNQKTKTFYTIQTAQNGEQKLLEYSQGIPQYF